MAAERYFIEVVDFENDKVVDRIEVKGTKKRAERVDRGININMNHERYFTRIVPAKDGGK